jgi:hypothetical protein
MSLSPPTSRSELDVHLEQYLKEVFAITVGSIGITAARFRACCFAALMCHPDVAAPFRWSDRERGVWAEIQSRAHRFNSDATTKGHTDLMQASMKMLTAKWPTELGKFLSEPPYLITSPDIAVFVFSGCALGIPLLEITTTLQLMHKIHLRRGESAEECVKVFKRASGALAKTLDPLVLVDLYMNYR